MLTGRNSSALDSKAAYNAVPLAINLKRTTLCHFTRVERTSPVNGGEAEPWELDGVPTKLPVQTPRTPLGLGFAARPPDPFLCMYVWVSVIVDI